MKRSLLQYVKQLLKVNRLTKLFASGDFFFWCGQSNFSQPIFIFYPTERPKSAGLQGEDREHTRAMFPVVTYHRPPTHVSFFVSFSLNNFLVVSSFLKVMHDASPHRRQSLDTEISTLFVRACQPSLLKFKMRTCCLLSRMPVSCHKTSFYTSNPSHAKIMTLRQTQ